MKKLCVLWFMLLCNIGIAQSYLLGNVTDAESGEALSGVTVMLNSPEGKLLKYAITSRDGIFRMELNETIKIEQGSILVFSYMGYTQVSEQINGRETLGSKKYNVRMKPQAMQIKEVVVRAPKVQMSGDTISYNVQSFANAQDKTIGDVLKKIPGIEVDKSGAIKYNGEAINKFYIEGADLLGGRYGLATNNINQKDVAKVEVLENHQPIKALKNVNYSDKAAINIKLKEGAKAKWLGQISAYGGARANSNLPQADGNFLWNLRLFAMSIGSKMQSINTFKTNNVGENLMGETGSFTIDELSRNGISNYSLPQYINVSPATTPNLNEQRTAFNKSAMFNSSNLWKLGNEYTLKGELLYTHNQIKSANLSKTEYFFEDGKQVADEQMFSTQKGNGLKLNINILSNTDKYFLNNKLKTNLQWDNTISQLRWNYSNVPVTVNNNMDSLKDVLQQGYIPSFEISNDFQFVKRKDNTTFTFVSLNKLSSRPNNLKLSSDDINNYSLFTKVNTGAFFTDENISIVKSVRRWNFTVIGGASAVLRKMERENDTLNNTLNTLNIYAKLRAVYESNRFRATFELPLSYYEYWYKQSLGDVLSKDNGSLFFVPRIALKWKVSSKLSVNLSGKIGESPIETDYFYAGSIMTNYRYIMQGNILGAKDREVGISLGVIYNNPLNLFYARLTASRNIFDKGTIFQQSFIGDYIVNSQVDKKNSTSSWFFTGEINKGLDFIKGKISLGGNYSIFDMQSIQNDILTPYISKQLEINTSIISNFAEWGNADYNLIYGRSNLEVNGNPQPSSNTVKQLLSLNIIPLRWLTLNFQGEHYYNQLTQEQSKHLYWIDAGVTFKIGDKIELSASISNLLNCKNYSYTIYTGLSSVYREYTIRPRNILVGIYWKF